MPNIDQGIATSEGYDVMLKVEFELFASKQKAFALAKEIRDRWANKPKDTCGKIEIKAFGAESKEVVP